MYALYFVMGLLWRRWFGGGFGRFGDVSRFFKYAVLLLIVLSMYWFKGCLDWRSCRMYGVIVFFMVYWAIGHGTWFVYWDRSDSGEGRLPLIDKIVWFCIGIDESRTFWGNAFGMFVRYTLTAIPVGLCVPSLWFMLSGVIVSLCYVPAGYKKNTHIGELLAGGSVFLLLCACL